MIVISEQFLNYTVNISHICYTSNFLLLPYTIIIVITEHFPNYTVNISQITMEYN